MRVASRQRRRLRLSWQAVAWGLLLLATAGVVVCAGLAAALRSAQPALALRFMPGDGPALARRASEILLTGAEAPAAVGRARAGALAALSRDATLVEAWRTLALIAPVNSPAAARLLDTAQGLSRRDLPTQLALIEQQVERGDIVGALRHYDIILRVSSAYDAILFPIMASASRDVAVRRALTAKLVAAPIWRRRFLSFLVGSNTPFDQQADLFAALAAAAPLADRDIVAAQASNAALGGQFAVADRLYHIVRPNEVHRILRGGDFDGDDGVPPYDWQLDTGDSLDAVVAAADGNRRLEIVSRRGDGLRAARQLVMLPAGRHRLTARYGALPGTAPAVPRLSLSCAQGGGAIAAFEGNGAGRVGGDVVVPPGCGWQWLEIGVRQDPAGTPVATWVDDVAIGASPRP